ncbi:MAG TPA: hypothetical protein PKW33_01710 [Anaerolineaceae bacterium]|nr:hypothetical protein [Anaerolineaceae bacterium]HPN50274.1 hypothetical protein [Anaerolineaceae bacterium]
MKRFARVVIILLLLFIFVFPQPAAAAQTVTNAPGQLAYISKDQEIILLNLSTGATQRLVSQGYYVHLSWSPDGRYLLFDSLIPNGSNLKILDLQTGEQRTLAEQAMLGAWAPDGSTIAFLGYKTPGDFTFYLETIKPDGSERKELVLLNTYFASQKSKYGIYDVISWAPDSKAIYTSLESSGFKLLKWDLSAAAMTEENLNFPESAVQSCRFWPAFHPDGRIAFTYAENCTSGVFYGSKKTTVINKDSQVQFTFSDTASPSWASDGKWLAVEQYQTGDNFIRLGVAILNLETNAITMVAADSMAPAWRPFAIVQPTSQPSITPTFPPPPTATPEQATNTPQPPTPTTAPLPSDTPVPPTQTPEPVHEASATPMQEATLEPLHKATPTPEHGILETPTHETSGSGTETSETTSHASTSEEVKLYEPAGSFQEMLNGPSAGLLTALGAGAAGSVALLLLFLLGLAILSRIVK